MTDLARIMQQIRATLYVPDGQPPQPNDPARDCTVAKRLLTSDTAERICTAIIGFGILRERGALESWCPPGQKATLRALNLPVNGGMRFFETCVAAGLKPVTRKSGLNSLGEILRKAAANG